MARTKERERIYRKEYDRRPEVRERRGLGPVRERPVVPMGRVQSRINHRDKNYSIISAAKEVPCADCGISYPSYIMDFDHRGDKTFSIGSSRTRVSAARLLAEIAKCDVVCANCHRARTYLRRHPC